jgi:uncharacterized membrane protein YkvA (DUF1232 family)
VAFHDSCYLGRYNGIFDAPREVAKSVPGLRLVELPRSRERGLCCGGGGGHMWMEVPAKKRVNIIRVEEALEAKVDTVAVGCPFCLAMIDLGRKVKEAGDPGRQGRERVGRREPRRRVRALLQGLPTIIRALAGLATDPSLPRAAKIALGAAALYLASPIDLVPDFIPLLGWVDDLLLAAVLVDGLLNFVDRALVLRYWPGPESLGRWPAWRTCSRPGCRAG